MDQRDLFNEPAYGPTPAARLTDPGTSHEAAKDVRQTGVASRQSAVVLDLVRRNPGRTSRELGELGSVGRHAVARRLPELERAGAVHRAGARLCRIASRRATTWEASGP